MKPAFQHPILLERLIGQKETLVGWRYLLLIALLNLWAAWVFLWFLNPRRVPDDWSGILLCFSPMLLVAMVSLVLTPAIVAGVAARTTSREIQSHTDDLLRLSHISDNERAGSYIHAALYRFRWVLVVGLGFLPLLAYAMTFNGLDDAPFYDCVRSVLGNQYCVPGAIDPSYDYEIQVFITGTTIVIAAVCLNINAAITGVGLATQRRGDATVSVVTASGIMLGLGIVGLLVSQDLMLAAQILVTVEHTWLTALYGSALSLMSVLSVLGMWRLLKYWMESSYI